MRILEILGYIVEVAMIISVPATIWIVIWAMGEVR